MNQDTKKYSIRIGFTLLIVAILGAILITMIGENPVNVVSELFNQAFGSKLRLGTTLASFTPILLTSTAFAVAAKAGMFNVGVEGTVFLGALAAAYVGIYWDLPAFLLMPLCFLAAIVVGMAWSFIPAYLKVAYNVNEVTVTILMNTVALYITSYFVSGPMSSGGTVAQSHPVNVNLTKFMFPSNANTGLFIGIVLVVLVYLVLEKTTWGHRVTMTGSNSLHTEYLGFQPDKVKIYSMMISGAIGGIAGCIEVLGVHGVFLNNFAAGMGTNGMLIALISNNNLLIIPFASFLIATLNTGGMGIQVTTDVPKSMIDTLIALIIVLATMEDLGMYILAFLKRPFARRKEVS